MNARFQRFQRFRAETPYRGLVLGNSHAAALRMAYASQTSRKSHYSLDFIVSGQSGLQDVSIEGRILSPTSDKTRADFIRFSGCESVKLDDFDFFLVVGLGFNVFVLEPLYREYICFGLKSWDQDHRSRQLVSQSLFKKMISNLLCETLSFKISKLIENSVKQPIIQLAQPRPSEILLNQKRFPSLRRALSQNDGEELSNLYEEAAADACLQHYLPQPPETRVKGLMTGMEFSKCAPRLSDNPKTLIIQPESDFLHANAFYGDCALNCLDAQISYFMQSHFEK